MLKILIVDNYDSFTHNLVQMVEEIINGEVTVIKNDEIELNELLLFDKLILSPGPGIPSEAGRLLEIISTFKDKIPMLGVCLGHQAIAEAFGGKLKRLETVRHGVSSQILAAENEVIFNKIKFPIQVARYHSWVVDEDDFPDELRITSKDEKGLIMSLGHIHYPIKGVQFHPESILTPQGNKMIQSWLNS